MKFRKKPVVIEAVQWTGANYQDIRPFCPIAIIERGPDLRPVCTIPTLEGDMPVSPGDWIIKGVKGEFYPCKPDIFEVTYEEED